MIENIRSYIVKLNDRNIQRQRETGFTLFAVLGAIIYCFFYILENLNILEKIFSTYENTIITIITLNIFFVLFLFYASFQVSNRKKRITKIFPFQNPLSLDFSDFVLFISLGLVSFINFYFLKDTINNFQFYFQLIFGILTGLNVISPFVIKFFGYLKDRKKRKKNYTNQKIDFTMFNEKVVKGISIGFFTYAIILLIFSVIVIFNLSIKQEIETITNSIKYTTIFYGLLVLIKIGIEIRIKQIKHNELEGFEKEIFFNNLTDEEIKEKFEIDFDGVPFTKWLSNKHIEIMNYFDTMRKEFLRTDLLLIDLGNIDKKTLPYEFEGRLNDIIKIQSELLRKTNDFIQLIDNDFKKLKNFGSLDDDEFTRLNYVYTFFKNSISGFNNAYNNLSNRISERQ